MLQLPQSALWFPDGQACDAARQPLAQPMAQTSRGFRATSPGFGMRVLPGSQQNTNTWWLPSPRVPTSLNGKGRAGAAKATAVTNGHVTRAVSFWENHASSSSGARPAPPNPGAKEIGGNVKAKEQVMYFMQQSPRVTKSGTSSARKGFALLSGRQSQAEKQTRAIKVPRRISSIRSVAPLPTMEAVDLEPVTAVPKVSSGILTPRTQVKQMQPMRRHCPSSNPGLKLSLALEDAMGWLSSVRGRLDTLHQECERVRPSTKSRSSHNDRGERGIASSSQQLSAASASTVEQVEEQKEEDAAP